MSEEWLCTTALCSQGKASVEQMERTYSILSANPSFNKARFEPTVSAIVQTFDESFSFFDAYIPFNPVCCSIKDIGAQADTVTAEMLASVNAAPIGTGPGSTQPGDNPVDTLLTVGLLVAGVVLVSNLAPLLGKRS